MKCIIVLSFVAFIAIQLKFTAAEEFKCVQGVQYIENKCNGCFCTKAGLLGCTFMLCPEVDSAKLYNCEVGTSWEEGSTKCWCVKDQGTICTK